MRRHQVYIGPKGNYQKTAHQIYLLDTGRQLLPWTWISTSCDTLNCIESACMVVWQPVQIHYPAGVCVYCGDPANTVDHLLPRNYTGEEQRRTVAVVPACGECNNLISDRLALSIDERRQIAHDGIRRKYRKLLDVVDRSPEQLQEFGDSVRSLIVANINRRAVLRERLGWPGDIGYDLRAFQKTGIDDPWELGLLGEAAMFR